MEQAARLYIANQLSWEGLDEIQRMVMASKLGCHVALDGPPGVGKTQCVLEVARLLGRQVFSRTCSSRTTESQLVAFPVLAAEGGATVTSYQNGPLCQALEAGGVFYGDEFNLLREDVQKRMNSAFDDRAVMDRQDGKSVPAKPGFWAVISYNPSRDLSSRDLDDSVADRFVHLHFTRWPSDFRALVAWSQANNLPRSDAALQESFGVKLTSRAIHPQTGAMFYQAPGGWMDFCTRSPATPPPGTLKYQAYDQNTLLSGEGPSAKQTAAMQQLTLDETLFARTLSRFTETVQALARGESPPILKKAGLGDLREKEDLELLAVHHSSTRIETAALKHYRFMTGLGMQRFLAQSAATRLVIDQLAFGQYRDTKLRNSTVYELLIAIAKGFRLMGDGTTLNTNLGTPAAK